MKKTIKKIVCALSILCVLLSAFIVPISATVGTDDDWYDDVPEFVDGSPAKQLFIDILESYAWETPNLLLSAYYDGNQGSWMNYASTNPTKFREPFGMLGIDDDERIHYSYQLGFGQFFYFESFEQRAIMQSGPMIAEVDMYTVYEDGKTQKLNYTIYFTSPTLRYSSYYDNSPIERIEYTYTHYSIAGEVYGVYEHCDAYLTSGRRINIYGSLVNEYKVFYLGYLGVSLENDRFAHIPIDFFNICLARYQTSPIDAFKITAPRSTQDGFYNGYDNGYSLGYYDGHHDGADEGYGLGYNEGFDYGKTYGYKSGYKIGYEGGYSSGSEDGYESGYSYGFNDGEDYSKNNLTDYYDDYWSNYYNSEAYGNAVKDSIESNDSNPVTAFFNSIWNGIINAYDTVTQNLSVGGVSLAMVITTIVLAVVVIWVIKVLKP